MLRRVYQFARADSAMVIRKYAYAASVATDGTAAAAGLAMLEMGGDFADGVIAHHGRALGGQIFASFDAAARKILASQGFEILAPV